MNAADSAWIMTATALVLFMTLPGLALFYGGLVRARNVERVHALLCHRLSDERAVVLCRLFNRIWPQRERALGRPSQGGPERSDFGQPKRQSAGNPVLCVPDDVRDHHPRPDCRCLRRTDQLWLYAAVFKPVDADLLCACRALGLGRRHVGRWWYFW